MPAATSYYALLLKLHNLVPFWEKRRATLLWGICAEVAILTDAKFFIMNIARGTDELERHAHAVPGNS